MATTVLPSSNMGEKPQKVMRPESDIPQMARFEQGDPIQRADSPSHLLHDELYPEDSYSGPTFWADLPFRQRLAWAHNQSTTETGRELSLLWSEFKADPLQPFRDYTRKYAVTGMGLFIEGYTLFSIGNITPLLEAVWPECWKTYRVCTANWVASVDYLEIVGIIGGQVAVGIIGDWIGRRWGMIQDGVVMLIGTILLTAMWGTSLQGWVIMYGFSLMIYSFGVGGEYPMTSVRAMEGHHGPGSSTGDKLHRGRNVLLAFLMQGWGQLVNQTLLILFLLAFHGGGNPPYGATSAQWTFRMSFVFIGLVTIWLIYHRVYQLQYADSKLRLSKRKASVTGYDKQSLKLVLAHYWHRLIGTAVGWFCNDFNFYGAKIFSGVFIKIVSPNSTVMGTWLWNLVYVGVALCGYYLAAALIDYKFYGRRRMQMVGFLVNFILYIISSAMFNTLQKPGTPIKIFQFLYFFSSFWSQFGPNSTTFLLAAEVYPAPIRATAHGVSAATGKLGALVPTVVYNYVSNNTKFWITTWFALIGFIVTLLFIPDTTGLDFREQERYWSFVRAGKPEEYHGIAIHPRHLSLWERMVLHRHRAYDPVLDRQARVEELRSQYEASISSEEKMEDEETVSENVSQFFQLEKQRSRRSEETRRDSQEKIEV